MARLASRLELLANRVVALDTAIFIYALEGHPEFGKVALNLLQQIEGGKVQGVASDLVLAELMVRPLRLGHSTTAARYEQELPQFPNLSFAPLSREVVVGAARLRAASGVSLLDALHLSAAREAGAHVFVTNDVRLQKPNLGLEVRLLGGLDAE